jgi:signal transduction histidine kinase/CheY-like chemotaxis protein
LKYINEIVTWRKIVSESQQLKIQLKELKNQLASERQTNKLLKKKVLQALIGGKGAAQCHADRKICEVERARAEMAGRVKSLFLENVSHEIRSSMFGLMGMTELVLDTELSPLQRGFLEMVDSSVERLMVVVNEVLDFSQIENGELELAAEDFHLKQSLDHHLYVLSQSAQNKGLLFDCRVKPSVPSHIHGDPARLAQVLTNLVNNAIKFTDNGAVSITIDNHGYDQHKKLLLSIEVRDSGCGVEPEKLAHINHYFKQQMQRHVAFPLSLGSTGLGLTVSSQLVKLMGGEIVADSDEKGSTFRFILPFTEVADYPGLEEKANQTFENITEESSYVLQGARVVLAEDEHITQVLIETVLKKLGVDVTSVSNGEAAVKLALSGDFQLVLMDIQMDGLDGLEATRKIRDFERKSGGHIPVVALTAMAMAGDREKCLQAGMDDYLAKPVERAEMVAVLNRLLTSRALVVDSDPESQHIFVRTLIESGWQVTIAESRRLAMYEACLAHFELIIFDIDNPSLEGLEAVKTLRKLEEYSGQRARIIGLGTPLRELKPKLSGVDSLLQRPLTREDIIREIGAPAGGRAARDKDQ